MKSALLLSLLLSSTAVFAAKEIEVKKCKSTYTTEVENIYSPGRTIITDSKIEVRIVQIKKALQKNSKFEAHFGILSNSDGGGLVSSKGGSTPAFSSLNGSIRENLSAKSEKINSVEKVILQVQKSLAKDAKSTGSNLENIELRDIKSATVYPVNAFQDEKINLIEAKDAAGMAIATILTVDDTIVLCK